MYPTNPGLVLSMMRWLPLCLLLTGCTTFPQPDTPVAPGNAQIRLSNVSGAAETSLIGFTGVQGSSCVLTVLGELPEGVEAVLEQGSCKAEVK